ncbi:ferredoxin [Candidatus Berkelbacteria bacterium CG_4_9_14_3_um_filter_39_23]|uniref:Ferredoxin n=2 Tax=Candidatus Berkelbacteria TaxID=1618330 RepID=A0A2M7CJ78_9BACT|nr:MAG: hypothetical protein AUK14_02820 [Candidatus Berkelbacteria bacterium CG2_30_39_44]PIR27611.1 MAG: ferredoxin [Candidatus Berkelbacteria bacterium CG11_big_fil_rev_8_21_14_0_20_40_23]PIV25701.1 MAG: ferredoxin [Candidatus Berkelbacteria bacterium CG03_land_8_20_14_0_80_40_36]PIZ28747.1 MAG: ferredoxin [Candidatus Berkelbacteria bacterium CG_4_10_14_0_8_um_filter_39_42]PJB51388.1 MAG: ferredoxin [Candidatus Berkelbacteria bacterium CG_4_9_14_3_um_filter_39_23]
MKIVILRDKCVGAGSCVLFAPKTFKLDKEGKVILLDENANSNEEILQGAQSCPVNAIEIYSDEGQKIYPKN